MHGCRTLCRTRSVMFRQHYSLRDSPRPLLLLCAAAMSRLDFTGSNGGAHYTWAWLSHHGYSPWDMLYVMTLPKYSSHHHGTWTKRRRLAVQADLLMYIYQSPRQCKGLTAETCASLQGLECNQNYSCECCYSIPGTRRTYKNEARP